MKKTPKQFTASQRSREWLVVFTSFGCFARLAILPKANYTISMDAAVQAELDKLKDLIINAMPVEQIYLFGSYARGTPRKDSDLDLYVVLKDDNPMRDLDAGLQISMAIARKKSMPVDIIAKKKKDFLSRLNDFTLERVVNREGIRIYGA